jgi:hypothetical protein
MPTVSDGKIPGGAPPLPPSPMTPDHALSLSPHLRVLPWYTPALAGAAGGLAGMLWWEVYARLPDPSSIFALAVASALVGLGICLADRAGRSRPRGPRWALGMAAVALLGWAYVVARSAVAAGLSPPAGLGGAALGLLRPSLVLLVASALPGLLFGFLAGERRRRWLMPLGGLCLLWMMSRLAIGLGLEPLDHGYCEVLALGSGGSSVWVADCATLSDGLWGLLLGLALATGDYCAARRQEAFRRA